MSSGLRPHRHVVAAGERVFITCEAETTSGKRFRNTEILTEKLKALTLCTHK